MDPPEVLDLVNKEDFYSTKTVLKTDPIKEDNSIWVLALAVTLVFLYFTYKVYKSKG